MNRIFSAGRVWLAAGALLCAGLFAAAPAAAFNQHHCMMDCWDKCDATRDRCKTEVGTICPIIPAGAAKELCKAAKNKGCDASGYLCEKVDCDTKACPPDEPRKPRPPAKDNPGNEGATEGEPHLYTFDRLSYDLQSAGEFILARTDDGAFEVQTRQEPVVNTLNLAHNTAVAMRVGPDRVGLYGGPPLILRINGEAIDVASLPLDLPGGGRIERDEEDRFIVRWPGDDAPFVRVRARHGRTDVSVILPQAWAGRMVGLLGNFDGDRANDLRLRDGQRIGREGEPWTAADIHGAFADAWRISQAESLFDYESGQSTRTFTIKPFPKRYLGLSDLDPEAVEAARQVCEAAGLTEIVPLENCMFDVAATGDETYAESHENRTGVVRADVVLPTYLDGWTPVLAAGAKNAVWQVSDDGQAVLQMRDGDPSFLVGPDDLIDVTIRLDIGVDEVVDNDLIGFALGYRGPMSDGGGDADFLLFDWKGEKANYEAAHEFDPGFRLARFFGPLTSFRRDLWDMTSGGLSTMLLERRGDDLGWVHRKVHKAEIRYGASRVQIVIDGALVADVTGTFQPGRFALYSYSQQRTRFANIDITQGVDFEENR